jgi:MscS family membrane protein
MNELNVPGRVTARVRRRATKVLVPARAARFNLGMKLTKFFIGWVALMVFSGGGLLAQTNGLVQIVEPESGMRFDPRTNITLTAETDIEGVRRVEFLAGSRVIGTVSNEPYSLVWSNVPLGSYQIRARVVSATGANVDSAPVGVRVFNALLTFGLDRIEFLDRNKVFDIPLWQFAASLIYIFLAFYISKFLDFLTRIWLKRWAERTATKFDDLVLDVLNGPIKIIAFVIFLRIGLEVFIWPPMVQTVLSKGFTIVIAWTLTYMALKFVDLVMGYWRQRAKPEGDRGFEDQLFPVIRKSLKVFIIVVGVLVTLDNIGVNITAAIASLSIGGLAIGLAAQDTLANLFGAVAVFVDKPFRIGDVIKLADVEGTVESIGMRSTRVRNPDGFLVTVPNKTMGNATITNVTRRPTIKTVINFGLTYETTTGQLKRAVQILEEVYRSHPQTQDVLITFNNFADSSLNINVVHWWKGTDGRACAVGMQELNFKVKERFEAERLDFAFPSRTIYLKQESNELNQPIQKS